MVKGIFLWVALSVTALGFACAQELHYLDKLIYADARSYGKYGSDVAVDGQVAVVGATGEVVNGIYSGAAFVYEHAPEGTWTQVAVLSPSDASSNQWFGYAVDVAGSRIMVGTLNNGVYVYEKQDNGNWLEVSKITSTADNFGNALDLDGDRVVIGAPKYDGVGTDMGTAFIYERQASGDWQEVAMLMGDQGMVNYFGDAVSLSGDRVLVGCSNKGSSYGQKSGAAYVFIRDTVGQWTLEQKLVATWDEAAGDYFGYSVALNGTTALIGSYQDDDKGENSGSAYIFELVNGAWKKTKKLVASDGAAGDSFGASVDFSGNDFFISAPYNGSSSRYNVGYVYKFSKSENGTWSQSSTLGEDNFNVKMGQRIAYSQGYLFAATSDYDYSSGAVFVFTSPQSQTLTFDELQAKAYGDDNFQVMASVNTNLPLTYAISNASIATVGTTGLVSIIGAGTTEVTVSQEGTSLYKPVSVTQTLTVNKAAQDITFNALPEATYSQGELELQAVSSSGLPISYTSSNTDVATITENKLLIVGTGVANIIASQSGNANYEAALDAVQDFVVVKSDQAIAFGALEGKVYGDSAFLLEATSSAGLEVTFTSSNPDVLSIQGQTATILAAGSANITATQAGDDNYHPAGEVVQALQISKASQVLSMNPLGARTYGDASFELDGSASSGLEVGYTSTNPSVAVVSGRTVNILSAGSTDIILAQSGNTNYEEASSLTVELTVNKAPQSIAFGLIADQSLSDESIQLVAQTTSGLPVSFTVTEGNGYMFENNHLIFNGEGMITIKASQPGNDNYAPASPVTRSFQVTAKQSQSIMLDSPDSLTYGDKMSLAATSTSALPVTYAVVSGPATLLADSLITTGVGEVVLEVTQEGNDTYAAAVPLQKKIVIQKAVLTVIAADQEAVYGEGLPVLTFTYEGFVGSEDASVLTSEPQVTTLANTLSDAGIYAITPEGGEAQHYAFHYVGGELVIHKADQAITVEAIEDKSPEDDDFALGATVDTGLPLTYSITGPADLLGATVSLTGAEGNVAITVTQGGTDNYNPASTTVTFQVRTVLSNEWAKDNLRVYPNPTSDFIQLVSGQANAHMLLYTMDGQLVKFVSPRGERVDVSDLQAGVYLVEIQVGSHFATHRLIIEK